MSGSREAFVAGVGRFLEGMEEVRDSLTSESGERLLADEGGVPPSPLINDPESLLPTLLEHRDDRPDGRCLIPAPIATLQVRAHLLQSEALIVLEALSRKKLIERVGEWESALVLEGSQQVKRDDLIITLPRVSPQPRAITMMPVASPVTPSKSGTSPGRRTKTEVVELVSVPLPAQAYNLLKARCLMVDDKGVVRGPVLVLQTGLAVCPNEAERILGQLLSQKRIEQIDGWRSVRLLSEAIEVAVISKVTAEMGRPADVVVTIPVETKNVVKIGSLHAARAYDMLKARSIVMDGRCISRGPVSLLHAALQIPAKEAIQLLEGLRDQHHIEQIDGWRAVYLLSDKVEITEILPKKNEAQPAKPKSAQAALPTRGSAKSADVRPSIPLVPAASAKVEEAASVTGGAIELMTRLLPALQQTRDQMTDCVAQLESAMERLRTLNGNPTPQQEKEAEGMVRQIIATNEALRKILG